MQFRREPKKLVDSKRSGSSLKKAFSKRIAVAKYISVKANLMDGAIAARYFVSAPDILEPIICSNISKSEGVILTKLVIHTKSSI
jgi:ATP-dependent RNA circularization protein (DNA/RNA ligase family)